MKLFTFTWYDKQISMWVHDSEALSNAVQRDKQFFEVEILDYIADHYMVNLTILDIGANIGNHTLYFAKFLGYQRIHCFEPHPQNFEILQRNIQSIPNCKAFNLGVSDKSCTSFISTDRINMGCCQLSSSGIPAVLVKLDDLGYDQVSLLKIDVEGSELDVLEGGRQLITRCKPIILLEVPADKINQYNDKIASLNYKCEKFWDNHRTGLYTCQSV